MAWETQGPIANRDLEKLGTTDRRRDHVPQDAQARAARRSQQGLDPIGVIRDPAKNESIELPMEMHKDMNDDGFESLVRRIRDPLAGRRGADRGLPLQRHRPRRPLTPLHDRVAVVAGGSGAIGAATVQAMLARRMRVVVAAPADRLLEEMTNALAPHGDRARCIPTDITVRAEIDALVAATVAAYGRIDVLANVAGIGSHPSLCDDTDAQIERVLAVNLLGAARLMHAVLPVMKAQHSGVIVNVGSIAGEAGVMGIYSGSKFGLRV